MKADTVFFKGHLCFQKDWVGFDRIKPINVIIGRNNSGKSHLLDLIEALSLNTLSSRGWQLRCRGVLDEESLIGAFPRNVETSSLGGDCWQDHGRHLIGTEITWEIDSNGICTDIVSTKNLALGSPYSGGSTNARIANARISEIKNIVRNPTHHLNNKQFRRLLADRDIRQESSTNDLTLGSEGTGASNIIRRFITSSIKEFPRDVIQVELLGALNEIFGNDGSFSEIQVQEHDDEEAEGPQGHWEVYLGEEKKGLISLSKSGSGLKTVILVLLNLLVVPKVEDNEKSEYIFAFEELENNLHPALLRRLLRYLEDYVLKEKATIFLTTHSSTALDVFGASENAQIIHVIHDGETARTSTVSAQFDRFEVISTLGARPSDLLQANSIVWVEGPSDRVYINCWIQLYSGGKLREGRDYQCAFFGGSLLAQVQFRPPGEEAVLANLFRINPNIVVICDGDREASDTPMKSRVGRIYAEVGEIPCAHIWVTEAREIENYIPGSVLEIARSIKSIPDPGKYEPFFPRRGSSSYLEDRLNRKHIDKMDLAMASTPYMTKENMADRFDWDDQIRKITERIMAWNT